MKPYANLGLDSNVEAFEIEPESLTVKFKSGTTPYYKYTHSSAGSSVIEHMKVLAVNGEGLNSFISTTKPSYESKWQ